MRVLAFCAQKGGVGKTTLAAHIAVEAERSGHGPVAMIDTDPQGSLGGWWQERRTEAPAFVAATLAGLAAELDRLQVARCRLAVIDTPPAISMVIQRVIKLADLVAIPTRPGPHDLRTVANTLDMVERANRAMVFVLNGAIPRAKITSDTAAALSQHGPVVPTFVHQRTAFATAMIDGRTVMETGDQDPGAREIEALWLWLHDQLERLERRRVFVQPSVQSFGRRVVP